MYRGTLHKDTCRSPKIIKEIEQPKDSVRKDLNAVRIFVRLVHSRDPLRSLVALKKVEMINEFHVAPGR